MPTKTSGGAVTSAGCVKAAEQIDALLAAVECEAPHLLEGMDQELLKAFTSQTLVRGAPCAGAEASRPVVHGERKGATRGRCPAASVHPRLTGGRRERIHPRGRCNK